MKSSDNLPDDKSFSSGWGYNYILSWISDVTRMNKQEFENWREIQTLQKKDPNFIKRYLNVLKSEEKVSIKNLTKIIKEGKKMQNIDKKEELLNLLNDTEKKIIAEIVKGTDFDKIYQEVGISAKTFPCCMSDIYRKTRNLIQYGKKLKKTVLMEYLFNQCGFKRGDVIDVPKNNPKSQFVRPLGGNVVSQTEKTLNETTIQEEKIFLEQNAKILENALINCGIKRIQDSLITVRDFLRGKYKEFCERLGDTLVQGTPQMALESTDYTQAKDYDNAIGVLNCSLAELKTKVITKQEE